MGRRLAYSSDAHGRRRPLTTAVVLGAFFLLWQVRTFVGWFVIALFLAAVLNPAVNWLQRRHRLMKRPLAIGLTYLGVLVALLLVVGIFVPVLVDQINGFIKFVTTAANAPEGPTQYIKGLAKDNGLGGLLPEVRATNSTNSGSNWEGCSRTSCPPAGR